MSTLSIHDERTTATMALPRFGARLSTFARQTWTGLRALWSQLPRFWWVMPAAGLALLFTLASGYGLSSFVGKYALTGKDFQEVLGPSLLAAAVVLSVYLWFVERHPTRAWMACLPAALLCRELHFAGTGTGIYVALLLIAIHAIRHRRQLQPFWNCHPTTCLWLGAISWYALAVTVDSGVWKFLPHSHWWSVNLEETLESGGHLAILLGVLSSVVMVESRTQSAAGR